MKIGIFDSGFGGLEILKEAVKKLPSYDFVFLGDTKRAPYGNRSKESIYEFTEQAVKFLFKKDCLLIILACNTVSADALKKIQLKYRKKKVLGVIIPASEEAVERTKNKRIGVLATERTVKSKAFPREINKIDKKIKVFQEACPLLAPIIESGEKDSKITEIYLKERLKAFKDIDVLVLGCTHYGLLENKIKKLTKNITIISEGKIVAEKLKQYLKRHPEIEKNLSKRSKKEFFSTDITLNFKKLGSQFFGQKINPKKVSL